MEWHVGKPCRELVTDREKLRLVLHNLFDNAVRHADEDGSISIIVQCKNNAFELCVVNSGCTIPPEDIASVFDRFWKHDDAQGRSGTLWLGNALVPPDCRGTGRHDCRDRR